MNAAVVYHLRQTKRWKPLTDQLAQGEVPAVPEETDLTVIEAEIEAWANEGKRLVTLLDADYPPNLRQVFNRPPFLFVSGRLLDDRRTVAVVGTRQASQEGLKRAGKLGRGLAERGIVVASGLARGIDTMAHRGALAAGGRTLAVIGTGLNRCYPAENRELQAEIARTGAVLSQFWPTDGGQRSHFPIRNVTMSGLSLATVVVEAGPTSGARLQAEAALKHGRRVLLLPSLLEAQEWARKLAEQPNVRLVGDVAQVVEQVEELMIGASATPVKPTPAPARRPAKR